MKSLSVKEYLSLKMPTEEAPVSDQSRILLALDALGYEHVTIPCTSCGFSTPCAGMRISILQ